MEEVETCAVVGNEEGRWIDSNAGGKKSVSYVVGEAAQT